MDAIVIPGVGGVGARACAFGSCIRGERGVGAVQEEGRVLDVGRRIGRLLPIDHARHVESQQRMADSGCCFPAVILPAEVFVKKPLKVVNVFLLVQIVPFLRVVDSKPFCIAESVRVRTFGIKNSIFLPFLG